MGKERPIFHGRGRARLQARRARRAGLPIRGRPFRAPRAFAGDRPSDEQVPAGTRLALVEVSMSWALLFLAGLCEIAWAVGLKYTAGFTRLWPTAASIVAMVASMGLL